MALIACPECNSQISAKAPTCPHCGAPIAGTGEARGSGVTQLTTTQGTSKRLKLHSLLALALLVFGAGLVWASISAGAETPSPTGGVMAFVGLVWMIVTRVRIWWHHD